MMLAALSLATFLILDIAEINPFIMDGPRIYWVQFESENKIISDVKYKRGERVKKPENPVHSEDDKYEYTFKGWDLSGDDKSDFVPTHAYYSFLAKAVYSKKLIKKPTSSSENPSSDSSEDSSNNSQSSSGVNNG